METLQEKIDALVAEYGAIEVVKAVKAHVKPDGGTGCKKIVIVAPATFAMREPVSLM